MKIVLIKKTYACKEEYFKYNNVEQQLKLGFNELKLTGEFNADQFNHSKNYKIITCFTKVDKTHQRDVLSKYFSSSTNLSEKPFLIFGDIDLSNRERVYTMLFDYMEADISKFYTCNFTNKSTIQIDNLLVDEKKMTFLSLRSFENGANIFILLDNNTINLSSFTFDWSIYRMEILQIPKSGALRRSMIKEDLHIHQAKSKTKTNKFKFISLSAGSNRGSSNKYFELISKKYAIVSKVPYCNYTFENTSTSIRNIQFYNKKLEVSEFPVEPGEALEINNITHLDYAYFSKDKGLRCTSRYTAKHKV